MRDIDRLALAYREAIALRDDLAGRADRLRDEADDAQRRWSLADAAVKVAVRALVESAAKVAS